jgi:hypothetical protein
MVVRGDLRAGYSTTSKSISKPTPPNQHPPNQHPPVDLGVLGTVLSEGGLLGIRGRSRDQRGSRDQGAF